MIPTSIMPNLFTTSVLVMISIKVFPIIIGDNYYVYTFSSVTEQLYIKYQKEVTITLYSYC